MSSIGGIGPGNHWTSVGTPGAFENRNEVEADPMCEAALNPNGILKTLSRPFGTGGCRVMSEIASADCLHKNQNASAGREDKLKEKETNRRTLLTRTPTRRREETPYCAN
jgi:hypothetical protein